MSYEDESPKRTHRVKIIDTKRRMYSPKMPEHKSHDGVDVLLRARRHLKAKGMKIIDGIRAEDIPDAKK